MISRSSKIIHKLKTKKEKQGIKTKINVSIFLFAHFSTSIMAIARIEAMFLEKRKQKNAYKLQQILLAFVKAKLMTKTKARELLNDITDHGIFDEDLDLFFARLSNFFVFFQKEKCEKQDLDDFQNDTNCF